MSYLRVAVLCFVFGMLAGLATEWRTAVNGGPSGDLIEGVGRGLALGLGGAVIVVGALWRHRAIARMRGRASTTGRRSR